MYRTVHNICMFQSDTRTCSPGSYKYCTLSAPIYTALFVTGQKPCAEAPLILRWRLVDIIMEWENFDKGWYKMGVVGIEVLGGGWVEYGIVSED